MKIVASKLTCACLSENPNNCWELRYYGLAGLGAPKHDEKCECSCHDEYEDEEYWDE